MSLRDEAIEAAYQGALGYVAIHGGRIGRGAMAAAIDALLKYLSENMIQFGPLLDGYPDLYELPDKTVEGLQLLGVPVHGKTRNEYVIQNVLERAFAKLGVDTE